MKRLGMQVFDSGKFKVEMSITFNKEIENA